MVCIFLLALAHTSSAAPQLSSILKVDALEKLQEMGDERASSLLHQSAAQKDSNRRVQAMLIVQNVMQYAALHLKVTWKLSRNS